MRKNRLKYSLGLVHSMMALVQSGGRGVISKYQHKGRAFNNLDKSKYMLAVVLGLVTVNFEASFGDSRFC